MAFACGSRVGARGAARAATPNAAAARPARPSPLRAGAGGPLHQPAPALRLPALRSALPSAGGPVTDDTVPEGHRGLHSALYGSGDAEGAHGGGSSYRPVVGEDDGGAVLEVESYLAARDGAKPPGVFAVYDAERRLQYVGFSRNLVLSIRTLRTRMGADRVAHVRALAVANQAMQSRTALQRLAQTWIDQAGAVPPGNGEEAEAWGGGSAGGSEASVDLGAMTAAERAEYEDRRLKLEKAMGTAVAAAPEVELSADERRARMISAVEGGDWSEVIDAQTRATLPAGGLAAAAADAEPGSAAAGPQGAPTSPFARASVHRKVGEAPPQARPAMTREAVVAALEQVRPYLQADGGDLEVVGVEGGVVALRLDGACSTCASSSATMKMGIERTLAAAFGDDLKGVVQVDKIAVATATVEAVERQLGMVRTAIASVKGAVEVASIQDGVVTLRFKGPAVMGKGLAKVVEDAFPDVKQVVITAFD
ncbi:hypothetical protein Rsub_13077 [Raphidocelis subcapitata]|uniref:NIF system FeS cluster assembly NifU C-terminal domain-containing protein n=1 Tax=Raphidocelis subcapitata TaxID=307507 RepID=A0A2V0PKM0_9CHLO|nr:hypothetical protein Rsub_13077 [Raphidocelis subcapitata]|eukprot:GBG00345.1 hypothetical protein Rsub_13077 [Raphidocelis subcapitata]